ncbi:MAG TPA: HAMP domain-containing sensor histidine kinase [Rhodocyclaceae bacterium]|nr:HAMP domain-containing sensor histidine kinase [Rhodocyclaceae bacterium]
MDNLVAAALHDAKNALAALQVWLDQARKQAPSAPLDQARTMATRLGTQLVELLAVYRQEQGSLRMSVADHDLCDFIDDLRTEWVLAPDSKIAIAWDQEGNAPRIGAWAFDGYLVKMVLLDALRNAERQAHKHIELKISANADGLCFTIHDDGPGFNGSQLPEQSDAPMHTSGSGLGLSFARIIAEAHHNPKGQSGRVEIMNAPEGGAILSLLLP